MVRGILAPYPFLPGRHDSSSSGYVSGVIRRPSHVGRTIGECERIDSSAPTDSTQVRVRSKLCDRP
jgi:hypothetical protein